MKKIKKNLRYCQHFYHSGRRAILLGRSPEADLLAGKFEKHGLKQHENGHLEATAKIGTLPWYRQKKLAWDFQGYDKAETRRELERIKKGLEADE